MKVFPAVMADRNTGSGYQQCNSGKTQGGSGVRGVGRGGRSGERAMKPNPRQPKEHFRATELCTFYAAGACSRGKMCNFAHDVADLKQKPNFKKTRLCEQFTRTGWCPSRTKCSFAHSKEEMQGASGMTRKAKRGLFAKVPPTSHIDSPGQLVAEKQGCQGKPERLTATHDRISNRFKEPVLLPGADWGQDLGIDPFSADAEPNYSYSSQNFDANFPQHLQESILAVLRESSSQACRELVGPKLENGIVLSL